MSRKQSYRPSLDGFRALVLYLVVAFHAGVGRASGGYIGVSAFFVLSGYLVTGILTRHLEDPRPIAWGAFYRRRIERLLPAAAVMLLTTAVVFRWVLTPSEAVGMAEGYRSAMLSYSNWYFWGTSSDYFAAEVGANPILHFWSLAIEVQFYAVWPVLIAGVVWLARRLRLPAVGSLQVTTALVGLVSFGLAMTLHSDHLIWAYYSLDARAYHFVLGALLALTPGVLGWFGGRPGAATASSLCGLAAIVLLATDRFDLTAVHRSAVASLAAVVVIASLESSASWLRVPFSVAPVTYLGRISYGTYLWHWPVVVLLHRSFDDIRPIQVLFISALLGTALAALSYEVLERPMLEHRFVGRPARMLAGSVFAVCVLLGVVVLPSIVDPDPGHSAAVVATAAPGRFTPKPPGLVLDDSLRSEARDAWVSCLHDEPSACTVVEGPGKHVLLLGDSIAVAAIPAFEEIARSRGLTLSLAIAPGCPWQIGVSFPNPGALLPCPETTSDFYDRVIPSLEPDLVVVVSAYLTIFPTQRAFVPTDPLAASIRVGTVETVDRMLAVAGSVVLVEPLPMAPEDPVECLREAKWLEDCRFVDDETDLWIEQDYRDLAARNDRVVALDLDRLACPYHPICDPVIGGLSVRWDHQHLTQAYGATLAPAIEKVLADLDLI